MNRTIVYPAAIPLDTDLLSTNKHTMIALAFAMKAILGTSTLADGLECTPTGPASMQVLVAPGSIYTLANTDSTGYGSLAADTTHSIVKQGISYDTLTLGCPAPVTVGQSVVYLIQAAFQETDTVPVVLPYYNSSDPTTPYSGPGNSGSSQNTVRSDKCVVALKTGVAATTGTQVTPAADAGYVGLWAITVANGATTITSPNIVLAAAAPFVDAKLTQRLAAYKNLSDIASAVTARTNLGAAASGANTDITSLASPAIAAATATTQAVNDSTTKVATTAFVNPASSVVANGYVKLASGLIIQWGQETGGSTTGTITYPLAFPTGALAVIATDVQSTAANVCAIGVTLTNASTYAYASICGTTPTAPAQFNWIAVGH